VHRREISSTVCHLYKHVVLIFFPSVQQRMIVCFIMLHLSLFNPPISFEMYNMARGGSHRMEVGHGPTYKESLTTSFFFLERTLHNKMIDWSMIEAINALYTC